MFYNYIKIAIRNLLRHKTYTGINIIGLSVGIAACLLLYVVVSYELSFENFQPNKDRIYRMVTQDKYADGVSYNPGVPFPALEAARVDFPQIVSAALYHTSAQITVLGSDTSLAKDNKKFVEEDGLFFADPQFFQVFQYKWAVGTAAILSQPNVAVLTKGMAEKYFGNWQAAVGQFIKLDNAITLKVEGILENLPTNTDFPLGIVTSFQTFKSNPDLYMSTEHWGSTTSNFNLYMLLPESLSMEKMNNQMAAFSKKYYKSRNGNVRTNFLQPLGEVHFDNRFENFGDHVISKSTIWTLSLIGLFILIMACINFINLSTAQAVKRSKEIGIRKVLGSNQKQVFAQVVGETAIIVVISVVLALAIAKLSMPYLGHIATLPDTLSLINGKMLLFIAILIITVTVLSGFYPSFILSRFNPALALKNKITSASVGGISLRRGLVVFQFAISQVLIVGTIVSVSQMNFLQRVDLGFNKEAIYVLESNVDDKIINRRPALKNQLLEIPGVESVSFSSDVPSSENNWSSNFAFDHHEDEKFDVFLKYGDEEYFSTYGLQLSAGRAPNISDTLNEIVINETLVKKLGIKNPADAVGKELRIGSSSWRPIVGVVKDFKTNSLKEDIKPTIIGQTANFYSITGIKLKSANITATVDAIQKAWNSTNSEYAFKSSFLDESINDFYKQEKQLSLLYKIFAGIAILISCLGLYGLVSFLTAQKTKEVGIRKVLGASVAQIVYLFSKEFMVLILIAFLIALPVALYLMNSWLSNFVFKVNLGAGFFIVTAFATIVIAWLTVGYKATRTAMANPVKSLKID